VRTLLLGFGFATTFFFGFFTAFLTCFLGAAFLAVGFAFALLEVFGLGFVALVVVA
jgi:hypothetical protein